MSEQEPTGRNAKVPGRANVSRPKQCPAFSQLLPFAPRVSQCTYPGRETMAAGTVKWFSDGRASDSSRLMNRPGPVRAPQRDPRNGFRSLAEGAKVSYDEERAPGPHGRERSAHLRHVGREATKPPAASPRGAGSARRRLTPVRQDLGRSPRARDRLVVLGVSERGHLREGTKTWPQAARRRRRWRSSPARAGCASAGREAGEEGGPQTGVCPSRGTVGRDLSEEPADIPTAHGEQRASGATRAADETTPGD